MLFALRYERDGQTQLTDLLQRLQDFGLPRQQLGLVRTLLGHAGADKRVGDLFSNRSFSSRFATMAKHSLRVSNFPDLAVLFHLLEMHSYCANLMHCSEVILVYVSACASGYIVNSQGVENVYTQHTPLLVNTLEALIRGRLKDTDFPYIDKTQNGASPAKVPKVCLIRIHDIENFS